MNGKLRLYADTVRCLRLKQIIGQIKKPFVMKAVPAVSNYSGRINTSLRTLIPMLDLNNDYLARFDTDRILRNEFTLLNETHSIDINTWESAASPLWRFNLHYFEYGIALAARYSSTLDSQYYEKFKVLVQTWITANPVGLGDAWHPYTISMRLPNWCICFDLFGGVFWRDKDFYRDATQSMYEQYKVLLKRQETWQLGNHYFENLKTIVLCSLLFAEQPSFDKYINRFLKEVEEEILPDGVHFELSIMYHKVILEDLIRAAYWLKQADKPQYKDLFPIIQKMINAVASLEKGMGKTPSFNDAGDGIAKTSESLVAAASELFGVVPVLSDEFPTSGYYKLYDGDIALMFDAGEIGPSYMPGHGHCDCLSFELSVNRKPILVNSGVYQYQGELRKYFRSTQAHNTLTIGGKEQSECWGEHRVARRITVIRADKNGQMITGTYKTYSGDTHTRMLALADKALTVLDLVQANNEEEIHSFLHIAPSCSIMQKDGVFQIFDGNNHFYEIFTVACCATVHKTGQLINYASQFGKIEHIEVIDFYWQNDTKQHGYIINFKSNFTEEQGEKA